MERLEAMEDEEFISEMETKVGVFTSSPSESAKVYRNNIELLHPLKQDACCLLCGQLAITYDLEGNVVKRERDDEGQQQQHFSFQDLFSFLCRCFKVKKEEWRFNSDSNDLFPFCQMCEFLLMSLAEIYCRLDELEEVLKAKMVEAEEEKFWKEGLYRKQNERYFTFRKHVLKEKFMGNHDNITEREFGQQSSSVLVAKSDVVVCEASPFTSSVEPGTSQARQLRSRSRKTIRNEFHSQSASYSDENDESVMDFGETEVDTDELLNNDRQSLSSIKTTSDEGTDSEGNPKQKVTKTTKKRKTKVDKTTCFTNPLNNAAMKRKVNSSTGIGNLSLDKKTKTSTWKAENAGYMVKDRETGNITYNTGYGNRFRSTRTVLQFTKLGKKGGYQCCTCFDIVPFDSRKQKSIFRDHFIRIHSPRYTCRLCQNPSRCSSQEELLQHVVSAHDMLDLKSYHKAVNKKRLLESTKKRAELKRKRESLYSNKKNNCEVCQMPFANLERDEIREHNMSHMNQTELQDLEQMDNNLSLIKSYQCHTCGRSFKGLLGLRSHARSHAIKEHKTNPQNLKEKLKKVKSSSRTTSGSRNINRKGVSTKCEVCEMPFAGLRQSEIDAHNWSHLGQEERERKEKELLNPDKETYQCQICPEIVKGKIALLVHEKTHADSRTVCSICGTAFKQKRTLDRHMEKVHPGGTWKGPFGCNYPNCSESLESDSSLLVHVEEEHASSEQARKRIMCLKCGKVLASAWAVKTHGLVHTKERNFHCEICSKTYSLKTTLEDHMAGMHGVGSKCATFRCDQPGCGAVFRSNVYFKIHLRRIHSIYVGKGKKNVKTHRNQ